MKDSPAKMRSMGVWIRVSSDDQARGESPKHHEIRAREYAAFNGWAVKELYDLSAVSGKTVMDHPEAKRMFADIRRGHISGLIFSKLARFARNTRELLEFADFFREHNADMVSLQEKIDTSTPAGRLLYTMLAALAQWEREEIADRVKASIKVRAKLGKSLGGAAPFGYMWKDRRLIVDPAEAPIRKLMYEMFAEQKRKKGVARLLNKAGHRTRKGARFTDTTVARLIQDGTAKGFYRANYTYRDGKGKLVLKPESEWVITPVEAIVSEELWNACNALLAPREGKVALGPKPIHLFAGLLFCGCGQKMYVFSRSPKYVCPKCRNKISIEDIEAVYREELQDFFVSQEKVQTHLSRANEFLTEKKELVATHARELQKVRAEMRKVYDLYQGDKITPDGFGTLYRPLEEREKALVTELPKRQGEVDALEIQHLSAQEVVAEAINLHRLWPKFTAEEKRRIVESITEKVVVTGDEIDITLYNTPSSEELTKKQRNLCAMLPFCERALKVSRKDVSPIWTRSYPVSKQPKSIGDHLRKKRFDLGIRQSEAANQLGVSDRTLSLWESDRVYPTWPQQEIIATFLGYNPFTNPALGAPRGNETSSVAVFSPNEPKSLGKQIQTRRFGLRKTRKQCAKELGMSVKTLWSLETNRRQPSPAVQAKLEKFLGTLA